MASFSPLKVENVTDTAGRPLFILLEELSFDSSINGKVSVTVPKGFHTNFASIPRVFWTVFPPMGPWDKAAVMHDYLYCRRAGCSRFLADALFREGMRMLGVPWWRRVVIYYAVRLFAWWAYRKS